MSDSFCADDNPMVRALREITNLEPAPVEADFAILSNGRHGKKKRKTTGPRPVSMTQLLKPQQQQPGKTSRALEDAPDAQMLPAVSSHPLLEGKSPLAQPPAASSSSSSASSTVMVVVQPQEAQQQQQEQEQEHKVVPSQWQQALPQDLVRHMLEFLPAQDILSCMAVCRDWQRALTSSQALKRANRVLERYVVFRTQVQQDKQQVTSGAFSNQPDLTPRMRAVLIDWMAQVNREFNNHTDTLHLAVLLVDLFCRKKPIPRTELQLVGVTCMLIAAKVSEGDYPDLQDLCFLCENIYTPQQLTKTELILLFNLNYKVHGPTVFTFLEYFLTELPQVQKVQQLAALCKYLTHVQLLSYTMTSFPKPLVAMAIVSTVCLEFKVPFEDVRVLSGYSVEQVAIATHGLVTFLQTVPNLPPQMRYIQRQYDVEEHAHASQYEFDFDRLEQMLAPLLPGVGPTTDGLL